MECSHYVFDAYGTLFDVHASVRQYASEVGENHMVVSEIWRQKQLEYTWTLTLMGEYQDFWELTIMALDYALDKAAKDVGADTRQKLLDAYWELKCFDEVPEVLKKLKDNGKRIAILSNGSSKMLNAAVESAGIKKWVDEVFSVDKIKRFKPVAEVYQMVCKECEVTPNNVCFQSSNRWDVAGAKLFGFYTIWVNRSGQGDEYENMNPDLVVKNLNDLPT